LHDVVLLDEVDDETALRTPGRVKPLHLLERAVLVPVVWVMALADRRDTVRR
jgi:hypothetical protein